MSDEDLEMQGEAIDNEDEMDSNDELNASSEDNDDDDAAKTADESQSSLAARNELRESMAADVEAFLSRGGSIQKIDDNVMADPPRKPTSNYGSRPI